MRGTEVKAVGSRGIMPQHRIFCRPPLTAKLSESLCLFLAQKPQTHPHSRSKTCFSVMQIATLTDSLQKQDNKWSNICIPHLCSGFPGQVKWMENSYLAKKKYHELCIWTCLPPLWPHRFQWTEVYCFIDSFYYPTSHLFHQLHPHHSSIILQFFSLPIWGVTWDISFELL